MNRAPPSDTAPAKLLRSRAVPRLSLAPPLMVALIFPLFLFCVAPHSTRASTGDAPVEGGGSYQQLPEPNGTMGQHQDTPEDHAAELKEIASLRQLVAVQQREIDLMKLQIRILAEPHPAQVNLPTSLPGNP
jgi:hypothetical protein